MTKQESINRFIADKVFGKCWHVPDSKLNWNECALYAPCIKCGDKLAWDNSNPDYCNSWDAFGRLWEKMIIREEWVVFIKKNIRCNPEEIMGCVPDWNLINPYRFAEAVARFYGWKEK